VGPDAPTALARGDDLAAAATQEAADSDRTAAFEAAVRPFYAPLVRRLTLVVGNEHDAQDLAQETYLRAFRSWQRFDGRDVRAWLYTIGLRLAFNHRRRRRRWLGLVGRGEPAPWTDRSDPDLWTALRELDARTRAAILLNVVDGYTQREIGAMLGVPEGTVASWIARGKVRLRSALEAAP
jgi:RNA polymerase sigma-70 factor (ECF subfamily)